MVIDAEFDMEDHSLIPATAIEMEFEPLNTRIDPRIRLNWWSKKKKKTLLLEYVSVSESKVQSTNYSVFIVQFSMPIPNKY
jgi:hypothetical protein